MHVAETVARTSRGYDAGKNVNGRNAMSRWTPPGVPPWLLDAAVPLADAERRAEQLHIQHGLA